MNLLQTVTEENYKMEYLKSNCKCWENIIKKYGSPIKMKLQVSELKRKLFNTQKEREDLREYSMDLLSEIDKLKMLLIKNNLNQEMWDIYKGEL